MSQRAISEYDAKTMWSHFSDTSYNWMLIDTPEKILKIEDVLKNSWISSFVVKPDQLFGKRGKYGLVWVNLDAEWVKERITQKWESSIDIEKKTWVLNRFLIEPFVPHKAEYYISIITWPENDLIQFSPNGWVEVEDNRWSIKEIKIPIGKELVQKDMDDSWISEVQIQDFIIQFFDFFKSSWFTYLEVNPFVLQEDWTLVCLDMVARVDTCEARKQSNWKHIDRIKPFGSLTSEFELAVEKIDAETWASLKFVTLNPNGNIWLLLWSGWASVAILDTFANSWQLEDIINYGELSWNPNYRHNKQYTLWLFDMLYTSTSKKQKYLCYIWPIANFTRIDVMWKAFVDALTERIEQLKDQNIKIVVRRGWVNDKKWLALISSFCEKNKIDYFVADGDVGMTDAMKQIK